MISNVIEMNFFMALTVVSGSTSASVAPVSATYASRTFTRPAGMARRLKTSFGLMPASAAYLESCAGSTSPFTVTALIRNSGPGAISNTTALRPAVDCGDRICTVAYPRSQ